MKAQQIFRTQTLNAGPMQPINVSIERRGTRAMTAGTGKLANALFQVGDLTLKAVEDDMFRTSVSGFEEGVREIETKMKLHQDPLSLVQEFQTEFNSLESQYKQDLWLPRARKQFEERSTLIRRQSGNRMKLLASTNQQTKERGNLVMNLRRRGEKIQGMGLAQQPEYLLALEDSSQEIEEKIRTGTITVDEGLKLQDGFIHDSQSNRALFLINQDPNVALEIFSNRENAKEVFPFMNEKVREWAEGVARKAVNRLDLKGRQKEQELRNNVKLKVEDHISSLMNTGEGLPELPGMAANVLSETEHKEFLSQQNQAITIFNTLEDLKLISPKEAIKKIESLKPESGVDGFSRKWKTYEAISGAYSEIVTQLASDPAAYVRSQDPAIDRPDEILAAQETMGVPSWGRRVLTVGESQNIVNTLTSSGPELMPQAIENLSKQYGRHFDQVYKELVAEGLPAEQQILTSVLDQPTVYRNVVASTSAKAELAKTMTDKSQIKLIDQSVRDGLADYKETVMRTNWSGATIGKFNQVQEVIYNLSLYYVSKGQNPNDASKRAVNEIITSKYSDIGGTFKYARIPAGVNVDVVRELGEDILDNLESYPIDIPDGFKLSDYIKQIRDDSIVWNTKPDSYWVTKPDDSGLIRMYNDVPILLEDGSRLEFDFPGRKYKVVR